MVIIFKRILNYFALPLIFTSALLAVIYSVPSLNFKGAAEICFAFSLPLCAVFYNLKNFKKSLAAGFCLLSADLIFYSFTGIYFSFVFCAVSAVIMIYSFRNIRFEYAAAGNYLAFCVAAVVFGLVHPYLYLILKEFSSVIAVRGAVFGSVNNFYELFISDRLSDLIYHTSYSKAVLTNEGIKTGVMNSLNSREAAQLLTGKYFVNISLTSGVFVSMIKRLGGRVKSAFIAVSILAFVFGDVRLLCLFILLFNPALYIVYLLSVFAAYLTPSMLDLRIGFTENGSLFELFRYGNNYGYFIAVAVVCGVLTYFLFRLVFSKFNISHGRYFPKNVRILLFALGGEDNIERIEGDTLYVINPNLIDVIRVDCDIKQNAVKLFPEDFETVRDYFIG